MALTIDDLLNSLQIPGSKRKVVLENTAENWARLGSKDSFDELGLSGSDLDEFLKEWVQDNPYSNI